MGARDMEFQGLRSHATPSLEMQQTQQPQQPLLQHVLLQQQEGDNFVDAFHPIFS
jgi:hypothetical protein